MNATTMTTSITDAMTTSPFIKFCGVHTPEDAQAIATLIQDPTLPTDALHYTGFVFYPRSKRFVTDEQAATLHTLLTSFGAVDAADTTADTTDAATQLETVGVFVDESVRHIASLAQAGSITIAQLHGSEDEAYLAKLHVQAPGLTIWQAFIMPDPQEEPEAFADKLAQLNNSSADLVLVDAGMGSGKRVNKTVLDQITRPFILAGGLSEEVLLEEGLTLANNPYLVGVDVSSGIETRGGTDTEAHEATAQATPSPQKDPVRMRNFIKAHAQVFNPEAMLKNEQPKQINQAARVNQTVNQTVNQAARLLTNKKGATMADQPADQPTKGRFGIYGGRYIPETAENAVIELEEAYEYYKNDPAFQAELKDLLNNYANRPSLLYYAKRMTKDLGGAKIYLKREDLNHTGAHKINNVLGQALLAKKMGKTRLIAETGAGQHGVATATAAALLDMECDVYMGKEDTDRQALNVFKMKLLGARVHPVTSGTATTEGCRVGNHARVELTASPIHTIALAPPWVRTPSL